LATDDFPLLIDLGVLLLLLCFVLGAVVALALAVLQRAKEWIDDLALKTIEKLRPTLKRHTTHTTPRAPQTDQERSQLVFERSDELPIIE